MTTLRNRWSALLLTLALLFSLTAPAMAAEANEAAAAPKTLEETAAAAAEAVMAYGTASVQYALWDNGEIVLTGALVRGDDLLEAVRKAAEFVRLCGERTVTYDIPVREGVDFEPMLGLLAGGAGPL